jgi:SH3-like domain-containing protein
VRAAWVFLAWMMAGAASAQTAAPPAQTTNSATHSTKPVAKPPVKKKAAAKKTPIVAPRHGAAVRKGVHPKAPVTAPKTTATAPAAKPAAKPAAPAKPAIPADEGTVTHLHLPRYVSLRSDEVNMRAGPAERFPILWVYRRKELPVKIEREFDVWRLVEDMDGIKGWMHQATLTGKRTLVITGTEERTLRAEANDSAEPVAVLKPGVVGRVRSCAAGADWCEVEAGGYRGWLPRTVFWGTDPGEAVTP